MENTYAGKTHVQWHAQFMRKLNNMCVDEPEYEYTKRLVQWLANQIVFNTKVENESIKSLGI